MTAPAAGSSLLVVKLAAIGDCLLALPWVRAVKAARPDLRVGWLVGRWTAPVVEDQGAVDEVIVVPDAVVERGRPFAALSLLPALRRGRWDTAVLLHRSAGLAALLWAARIGRRVGLARGGRSAFLEAAGAAPGAHESAHYRAALEAAVGPLPVPAPGFRVAADRAAAAAAFLAREGFDGLPGGVIGLIPGGGINPRTRWTLKRWPARHWTALAERAVAAFDCGLLLFGLPEETRPVADTLPPAARGRTREVSAAGLRDVAALLARCRAVVATDGGLMHLAAAVGRPVVALFGPTNPAVWSPAPGRVAIVRHEVFCQPCYRDDGVFPPCPYRHECLDELPPEQVLDALRCLALG